MRQIHKFSHLIVRSCALGTLAVVWGSMVSAADLDLMPPGVDARYLIWRPSVRQFAVPQPYVISIAAAPGGTAQIGFTHSGYTSHDIPRSAGLLVAFSLDSIPLSAGEEAQLRQAGYTVYSSAMLPLRSATLDLTLAFDPIEEKRLRQVLGLPRKMTAGSSGSLNITWQDVRGAMLYKWLTDPNGLKFVVTTAIEIRLPFASQLILDRDKLTSWWVMKVGSTSTNLDWKGGPAALSFELATTTLVRTSANDIFPGGSVDYRDIQALASVIGSVAKVRADGSMELTFDALMKYGNLAADSGVMVGNSAVSIFNQPGIFLDKNPEYVTDAGVGVPGLDALLRDN